jgi:Leucine-rich repeat (LRR) protein
LQNLESLDLSDNQLPDLPKNIFSPLVNLHRIHLYSNQLTTIHSDSFENLNNLHYISLFNNKINAFDKKLLDLPSLKEVFMIPNVCTNNYAFIRNDVGNLRKNLKKCFKNYQPRQEK